MTEDIRLDDIDVFSLNTCLSGKMTLTTVCVSGHLTEAAKRADVYIGQ